AAPLDASRAQDVANYIVVQAVRHRRRMMTRPVGFKAVYNASKNSVQLLFTGRPRFAQGGQIILNESWPGGLTDASGASLAVGNPSAVQGNMVITIGPKASGITV